MVEKEWDEAKSIESRFFLERIFVDKIIAC